MENKTNYFTNRFEYLLYFFYKKLNQSKHFIFFLIFFLQKKVKTFIFPPILIEHVYLPINILNNDLQYFN